MVLDQIDLFIVGLYAISLFAIALVVSREPVAHRKDTEDYFLAGKALPWWAIGASLIAANISEEQIIRQSGQGFVVGVGVSLITPKPRDDQPVALDDISFATRMSFNISGTLIVLILTFIYAAYW